MKKLIPVLLFLFTLTSLSAMENFIVDGYHVDVSVSDDSVSTFNEFLDLDFITPSHGIIRDIQYRFSPYPFKTLTADISNIKANVDALLSYNGDYLSLRLGNPDEYVFGSVYYHIMYDYLLEDDGNREYDEWYMNLLSPAWDTNIGVFSFSVTFPHPVDRNRIWVTYGEYGSVNPLEYTISSDGLTVSAVAHDLGPYSAVTLRAEFDEGYFASKELKGEYGNTFNLIYMVLAVIVLAFIYYSYMKLGRDKELISPVCFTPPEGLSSLDVGYIIDNTVTFDKDILSMFFYFADKGYMKIEERGKDDFLFTKLKDIDKDRPSYERRLFSMIFQRAESVDIKELARRNFSELASSKISPEVERSYEKNHPLFEPKSLKRASIIRAIGMAFVIIFSVFTSISDMGELTLFILFSSLVIFALLSLIGHRYFSNNGVRNSIMALQIAVVSLLLAILVFVCSYLLIIATYDVFMSALLSILNAAVVFSSSFFSFAVNKRSDYADEMLSKILGYKEFLEKVEMEQLRRLIEEDPEFYYHNLSYAVALNLEEKYSRKFEALSVSSPSWYASSSYVGSYMMWHAFSTGWRRSYAFERSLIAPPPENRFKGGSGSHSGFSGFSGGGFSGGGGRSW